MSEKPRKKTYWVIAGWLYIALAIISTIGGNETAAVAWVVCTLVCVATRQILNAIERSDRT